MSSVAYHVTSINNLASIRKEGVRSVSCWTVSLPMAKHYCENLDCDDPIILMVPLASLSVENRIPDYHSLADCCVPAIRASSGFATTEDAYRAWEASEQDWQTSLNMTSSFGFISVVMPEHLLVMNQDWRDIQSVPLNKSVH